MKGNVFIKRPVMAISIAIIVLIVGTISLLTLPIEQYPDIAPPTVVVTATYTGADADAVLQSVVMPLEESINGVENMIYMTSTSTNTGVGTISVYFKQGTNPDMAAVNVQNRVAKAQGLLPAEVTQIGVITEKRQSGFLQITGMVCNNGRYDEQFIANYLDINVFPQIKRIEGVSNVQSFSDSYSLRIWLKPDVMAQYKLMPSDISLALAQQNIVAPAGSFGENSNNTFQYVVKYRGRLKEVSEFENIVIKSGADGHVLHLKDIADVELGAISYSYKNIVNENAAVNFMITPMAGVNTTEVNRKIIKLFEDSKKDLPEGLEFVTLLNTNEFLFASIDTVIETLIIAILLVVLIIYFFLQDLRTTLIPSISIIVSIIGTFAVLQLAGFSINILTLFALVLAIGTVVDDAIVVVEAVQSKFDSGYKSAYLATKDSMEDVTMAIITCSLVFMAVFIPVTFTGGTAGVFYTQFGVTMAVAVGISALTALSLSPALAAMLLKPATKERGRKSINYRVKAAYNASYSRMLNKYKKGAAFFISRPKLVWSSLALALVLFAYFLSTTQNGLVPQEDKGMIIVNVGTSPGNTLAKTSTIMKNVEDIVKAQPEVKAYSRIDGFGIISGQGSSYGTMFINLKTWNDRPGKEHSIGAVMARLNREFANIKEARVFVIQDGMIPGYGMGNAIDFNLQDRTGGDLTTFYNITNAFVREVQKRPEVAMAYSSFNMNFPQYLLEVDAAKCLRAGISPNDIMSTMSSYYGGNYTSNFNQFGKIYRVMMQASPKYRLDQQSLGNIYVRNGDQMAPISQFVTLKMVNGPEILSRFNLYSSIGVNVSVMPGYAKTEVLKILEDIAAEHLPTGYSYEYGGISREEAQSGGNTTIFIYVLCIVLIYFILSSLYESFFVPFAVILSVPFGLMGSFLFARLFGLENNIYLQTGIIMLIGLLSKTAILITEYASERRRKGMGITEAAYSAAVVRFRPIMMTVLTMVIGLLPLMFSTGAGANGNSSLGTGVIGGMIIGTLALLFVVPVFFIFFQTLQEKYVRSPEKKYADKQVKLERENFLDNEIEYNLEDDI